MIDKITIEIICIYCCTLMIQTQIPCNQQRQWQMFGECSVFAAWFIKWFLSMTTKHAQKPV